MNGTDDGYAKLLLMMTMDENSIGKRKLKEKLDDRDLQALAIAWSISAQFA